MGWKAVQKQAYGGWKLRCTCHDMSWGCLSLSSSHSQPSPHSNTIGTSSLSSPFPDGFLFEQITIVPITDMAMMGLWWACGPRWWLLTQMEWMVDEFSHSRQESLRGRKSPLHLHFLGYDRLLCPGVTTRWLSSFLIPHATPSLMLHGSYGSHHRWFSLHSGYLPKTGCPFNIGPLFILIKWLFKEKKKRKPPFMVCNDICPQLFSGHGN